MRRLRKTLYAAVTRSWRAYHMRRRILGIQRHRVNNHVPVSHAAARRFWRRHFGVNICTRWHDVYAQCSSIDDPRYVPEDLFYASIMPALNIGELEMAYADKNFYQLWLPEEVLPEAVLRCVHYRFYSFDFSVVDPSTALSEAEEYFIKPSLDSGGGKQVALLNVKAGIPYLGGVPYTWQKLVAEYQGDFVVQRRLQQHPDIAALNASSVNTLRIMTLRMNDELSVVTTVLRIGRAGSHVDNMSARSSVACGVLPDGRLNTWASDPDFNRVQVHPDAGYALGGQQVPGIQNAWDFVLGLHRPLLYFDLVAWDVSIGPDCETRVVEANLWKPAINMLQTNNGPLFGDRTEEVLSYVRSRAPYSSR